MKSFVTFVTLLVGISTAATSQQIRVAKVLLRRDLDGDGKPDSVVSESKRGSIPALSPTRAAVYLSSAVRRGPSYATPWDDEYGSDVRPDRVVSAGQYTQLLVLSGAGADNVYFMVLRVRRGAVVEIASHNIDYGEGDFDVQATSAGVMLRVSPPHNLQILGAPKLSAITCPPPRIAAAVARYDEARGTFITAHQQCVERPRG